MITLHMEPVSLSSFFFFDLIFCTLTVLILASKLTWRKLWRVEIFAGYNFFGSQPEDTLNKSLPAP